jgi:hypothetical protein
LRRFSNGKDKVRSNAVPITVSLAGNTPLPLVSVSRAGAATVSHHHGPIHTIQQQVNQHHHVVHHQNVVSASPQQRQQFADPHSLNDSNNAGIPIIPVVSAAPLAPEKVSPVTFQPNQQLPPATVSVSTCPPVR